MSITSISIRRPVLATVMALVITLFGVIGFTDLGVREYPAVDPPFISVSTSYAGANADVIESQITEPIEESVNAVDGIRALTSVSREGRSTVTVEFDLDVDLERAANDVRDRVAQAVRLLPPDADPPVVSKADADAMPIVFLSVRSDTRNLLELTEFADNVFKERLQTISGVSRVDIWGSRRYSMRLWMDPHRLAAYQMTPQDIRQALERENVELPSGRIEGADVELTIRTLGRLTTPEDFDNLIIREVNGQVVRFRDVGRAELAPENERTVLKRDGIPMVGVVLRPQPGSNHIDIVDEFYHRLAMIERDLPSDISLAIGFDLSQYVRQSVREVQQTIFIALILVVLVIFLFLREWRTTIIPAIVIPIALTGSFFIMYLAGFSINVLTLLALVLAIGLVVDDAIVVVENIFSKIEDGYKPVEAGIIGTREIFFAIVSTTLALVAVFLPVIFLGGMTGRLFREFGIVLAGAVVISSFIALTLTPMLTTRLFQRRKAGEHGWLHRKTEPFYQGLTRGYRSSLEAFVQRRWLAFPVMGASFGVIFLIGSLLPSELAPLEDRSRLQIMATAPEGATFEYMDAYMSEVVRVAQEAVPEAEAVYTVTSPGFGAASAVNSGFAFLILSAPAERERTQQQIAGHLTRELQSLTGARTFVVQDQTIGQRRGGLPVQYVLQSPDFERLRNALPEFLQEVQASPVFSVADVNLKFNKPELRIHINRSRASAMGVSTRDIAQTIQLALSEGRMGFFIMDGKQYSVIGQVRRENRSAPGNLRSLFVRNNRGELVSLDNLVDVSEEISPPQLFRFNRFVSATVSAGLMPGYTVGDGIEEMDAIAARVLDESFATTLAGEARDFVESSSSLVFVFFLALILVFLVLSAQFESFRDPFTVMLTVPLALTGALVSLWLFGQTLNIFSQIGIIMLIGLVTKNGILIVEFANQRREAGRAIYDAIIDAAAARFRPVLMTSLSTILGVLPIALALGAGAESRIPMGLAIIGGLIFGSLLTLYVIPAMYTYLTSRERSVTTAAAVEADGGDGHGKVELEPREVSA